MLTTARFHVYADINCPFCYALNERIFKQGLSIYAEWRPIQHSPTVSSGRCTFDSLCELTSEVSEVRRRSPSTEIAIPPVRPNSAIASEYIAEVGRHNTEKAAQLRLLIYRALWQEGKDVSQQEVLQPLLQLVGFESLAIGAETHLKLSQWQQEWEQGEFDHNIPVTIALDGKSMIGFPEQSELDAFICDGCEVPKKDFAAVCNMKPRQTIMLLERDVNAIQQFFILMKFHDVIVLDNDIDLQNAVQSNPPDIIVMNLNMMQQDASTVSRTIKLSPATRDIPVIALTSNPNSSEEVSLFEAGAADYISKPVHDSVLQARLNLHLERKRSKDLLERMARYDELTEVLNRRAFNVSLQAEWGRSIRNGTPLAVLMIDVDFFKQFNDSYGHNLGDQCLRQVASRLQDCLKRPSDHLARYGGEEFVVILPDTDALGAMTVAENCCQMIVDLKIPHQASEIAEYVTISIGASSEIAAADRSAESLVDDADRLLYKAKNSGRNRAYVENNVKPEKT